MNRILMLFVAAFLLQLTVDDFARSSRQAVVLRDYNGDTFRIEPKRGYEKAARALTQLAQNI